MSEAEIDFDDLPETPTLNPAWKMDTQELVYTALQHVSGDYCDADDDCAEQIIQRARRSPAVEAARNREKYDDIGFLKRNPEADEAS